MFFIIDTDTNIYHRYDCNCLNKCEHTTTTHSSIPGMYLKGYLPCEECSPMLAQYEAEKKESKEYAMEHGLQIEFRDESVYIDSFISSWKIIYTQRFPQKMKLLHENTQSYYKCRVVNGNIIKQYHDQEVHYSSILMYLEYIVEHDAYKNSENNAYRKKKKKTRTDRYLYNRSKRRNVSKGVRRVCNLIDELEAKRTLEEEEMGYGK